MTCNHCGAVLTAREISRTAPDRMFRGMCDACEDMPLETRIEKFPELRAVVTRVRGLGLGLNGPLQPGFMKRK